MREKILDLLGEYGITRGFGAEYIVDAVELFNAGDEVGKVYELVAKRRGKSAGAVAKAISLCASAADCKPKALIARVKERILFESGE